MTHHDSGIGEKKTGQLAQLLVMALSIISTDEWEWQRSQEFKAAVARLESTAQEHGFAKAVGALSKEDIDAIREELSLSGLPEWMK